jgi:hypothetical protein
LAQTRRGRPIQAISSSFFPSLLKHKPFSAIFFEDQADGVNDLLLRMRLAVLDHLMLDDAPLLEVGVVLVREAVVPTAVPAREGIRVFLIGVSELTASQRLNVNESYA